MYFFCNFFIWFWDNKDILAQITGWNESPHKTQYTNWTHRRTLFGILKHRRLVFTISTKYIGILWYLRLVNRVLIGDQSHFITPLLKNSLREIKPARKSISDLRPLKISDYLIIHFTMSGEWAMKMLLKLDKLPKLTKCMIDNLKFWLTFFRSVLLCPDCLFRHILQFNSLHIDRILG